MELIVANFHKIQQIMILKCAFDLILDSFFGLLFLLLHAYVFLSWLVLKSFIPGDFKHSSSSSP